MKPEDAQQDRQALEIFGSALGMATAEARAAYLESACGGDAALKARVQALLANHFDDTFLEKPAAGLGSGAAVIAPVTEQAGDRIGRYKLLQKIGEGGMGIVYMAEQEEPVRRQVALKIIKLGMDTRQVIARFEAERQALAMMDHPSIAKVFDGGVIGCPSSELSTPLITPNSQLSSGRPYFVMELVRGVPITTYCDKNHLGTAARLGLFIQVCHAIQHAHQKGVIHRDIKPSNVMVTLHDGAPVPKVIDFGIAKATGQRLTEKTLFTHYATMIGTPAYMSPEQAEMSALDVDTRADVYSLGVLLYELLTGTTPFPAEELLSQGYGEMQRIIAEVEPPRPSTRLSTMQNEERTVVAKDRGIDPSALGKGFKGDLDWIVMKCLEKDRTRRYDTANSCAQDLQRHLANEPVLARPPSTVYRITKAIRRNKLAFAAGAAVAAALVIGMAVSTWGFFKEREAFRRVEAAEQEQRRERTSAEQARGTAALERDRAATLLSVSQARQGVELLEKSDPAGLLYLLEARKSVEHLPEERLRRTLLWSGWMGRLPKSDMKALEIPIQSGGLAPLLASPITHSLGRPWMATCTTNGQVILWDSKTGKQITAFTTGNRPVGSPEFTANGRLLVVNANGSLQLWDLSPVHSNQPPRRLLGRISRHAFDPNHRRVLTFANQGMPLPGESPEAQPDPSLSAGYQVQVWDSVEKTPLVATWEGDRQDLVNSQFALSVDGSKVAAGWHALALWDANNGRPLPRSISTNGVSGSRGFFDPFWFSPNGRWLWEVRGNRCWRYDLNTGQPVGKPITGLHRWNRPEVSPAGQHLILSLEKGFQIAQLDSGENMGPLIRRDDVAMGAPALSPDGLKLATSGPDRAIRCWDTTTGRQVGQTITPPMPASSATFSADGNWLSIATQDGRVRMHSLAPQSSPGVQEWSGVKVLGFSTQGQLLTYAPGKQTMEWRDPGTGKSTSAGWTVPDRGPLIGSALSADGGTVAAAFRTGSMQSLIRLWNTATGTPLEPSITWTNAGGLAFSPDGRTLAGLGGGDGSGSIQLWDVMTRQPQSHLPSTPMQVTWLGLRFSPDGRFIAARNSYVTYVWDLAARRLASGSKQDLYLAISDDWTRALTEDLLDFSDPRQPRPAPNPVTSRGTPTQRGGLALSVDGRLRASEAGNKSVRLWDNITGRPVGQEMKLGERPHQCVFSPDSRLLAIFEWGLLSGRAGSANSLRLWDTATGLPCGPAVPLAQTPVDFLFDREVRFLAVPASFETTGAMIIHLPDRELPLAEMERQSWLSAGSRLDEAGNVEILSAEEIIQLEASTSVGAPPAKTEAARMIRELKSGK